MTQFVLVDDVVVGLPNADKLDAQAVGEELEALASGSAGRLSPDAVVNAARDPKSAMHSHFEWRDDVAADAYRRDQARTLVRIIRAVPEPGKPPIRAFVSVRDSAGVSYRTSEEISGSIDLQLSVLRACERDLEAIKRRYRDLHEICTLVDLALIKVQARKSAAATRVAAE